MEISSSTELPVNHRESQREHASREQSAPHQVRRATEVSVQRWERLLDPSVRKVLTQESPDSWPYDGNHVNPVHPDGGALHKPFPGVPKSKDHITEIARRLAEHGHYSIMIFGPGQGTDIPWLRAKVQEELRRETDDSEARMDHLAIDVLALTDRLCNEARTAVRMNFSGTADRPTPFETFDTLALAESYGMVIDQFGVAVKSSQPHRTILKQAELLAPGGTYIEVELDGHSHPSDLSADTIVRSCRNFWSRMRKEREYRIAGTAISQTRHWFVVERV